MNPHTRLVQQILRTLGARPDLRVWRNSVGARVTDHGLLKFGLVGSSDILGILRGGQLLAIECKTGKGRLTSAQEAFRTMILKFGGLHVTARSVDDVVLAVEHALREQGAPCLTPSNKSPTSSMPSSTTPPTPGLKSDS